MADWQGAPAAMLEKKAQLDATVARAPAVCSRPCSLCPLSAGNACRLTDGHPCSDHGNGCDCGKHATSSPIPRNQKTSAVLRRVSSELFAIAQGAIEYRFDPKEMTDLAIELRIRAQRIEVERESADKTVADLDASKVEKVLACARLDTVKYIDDAPQEKADVPTARTE